jgi:hypothetical protein
VDSILFAVENYFFFGTRQICFLLFHLWLGYYKLRGKIRVKWNIISGSNLYKINRGSLDLVGPLGSQFTVFQGENLSFVDFDYAIHINLCLIAITQPFCNNCLVHDDLRIISIFPIPGSLSLILISKNLLQKQFEIRLLALKSQTGDQTRDKYETKRSSNIDPTMATPNKRDPLVIDLGLEPNPRFRVMVLMQELIIRIRFTFFRANMLLHVSPLAAFILPILNCVCFSACLVFASVTCVSFSPRNIVFNRQSTFEPSKFVHIE